jgi:hypothetical protein
MNLRYLLHHGHRWVLVLYFARCCSTDRWKLCHSCKGDQLTWNCLELHNSRRLNSTKKKIVRLGWAVSVSTFHHKTWCCDPACSSTSTKQFCSFRRRVTSFRLFGTDTKIQHVPTPNCSDVIDVTRESFPICTNVPWRWRSKNDVCFKWESTLICWAHSVNEIMD